MWLPSVDWRSDTDGVAVTVGATAVQMQVIRFTNSPFERLIVI